MTAAPAPPLSARTRPATPAQLDWLAAELPLWRAVRPRRRPGRHRDPGELPPVPALRPLASAADPRRRLRRRRHPLAGRQQPRPAPAAGPVRRRRRLLAGLPGGRRAARRPPRARVIGGRHPVAGRRLRPDPRGAHVRGRRHAGGPEPPGAGVRAAPDRLVGPRSAGPRVRRPRHRPARGRPGRPRLVAGLADHLGRTERPDRAPGAVRRRRDRRGRRRVARGPAAGFRRTVA